MINRSKPDGDTRPSVRVGRARAEGAFLAAAIGDALGWPHEMRASRPNRDSASRTMQFQAWEKRAGGRFQPHEESIEAGQYSDDTQLILAITRSLLHSSSSWWLAFATEELPLWTIYQRGGGSATRRAAASWAMGVAPWEAKLDEAERYFSAGGNGVAMRVLPHCLRHANGSEFAALGVDIMTDGVTTHGHPRALVGALAYGYGLWEAFRHQGTLEYGRLLELVRRGHETWGSMPSIGERWAGWAEAASRPSSYDAQWSDTVREQLDLLEHSSIALAAGVAVVDEYILRELGCFDRTVNGSGTVNAAAALFLACRHAADPTEGLRQATLAEGADTDTLASMTGGILGAALGPDWVSPFVPDLQDSEAIRSVANALHGQPQGVTPEQSRNPITKSSLAAFIAELENLQTPSTLVLPNGVRARAEAWHGVESRSRSLSARAWRVTLQDGQTLFIKKLTRVSRKDSPAASAGSEAIPTSSEGAPPAHDLGSQLLVPTMSAAQFAIAFDLRPNLMAWFLGAGASAASGIPTGYAMIRDFKTRIFCREMDMSRREVDTADPIWVERIDAFFRHSSLLPPDGDPTEYAKAFEAVYPQPRHRRQYIDDAISRGTPCFGHKVLGSLMAAGKVDCVFTTNFDPLIEDTAIAANAILPVADRNRPTVAAIDSADRAMRCLNESDWPLVAKLHGDYQSSALKNTDSELENQDLRMRHVLVEAGQRFGMVFVGYSGRDASIMQAVSDVLNMPTPFPNGLYWLTSSASRLLPAVSKFLNRAQLAGVDVAVVECATFDELAATVIKTTDLPRPLLDRVMEGRPAPRLVPVQPPTADARAFPVLRYSALLIEGMPRVARRMKLAQHTTSPVVRELLKEQGVRATVAAQGRELAVFGRDKEIVGALAQLGATLNGEIALDPIADSWAMGLIYDAMVRGLARRLPLIPRYKRSGHSIMIATPREGDDPERIRHNAEVLSGVRMAYKGDLSGNVPGLGFPYQEGVLLKLDLVDRRWWCGFEPYTFVHVPRPEKPQEGGSEHPRYTSADPMDARSDRAGDPAGDWRRERWAQRYNRNWAGIIDAWAQLLTSASGRTKRAFGLEDGAGIDAVFDVSPVTGWSRPSHHHAYFDRTT